MTHRPGPKQLVEPCVVVASLLLLTEGPLLLFLTGGASQGDGQGATTFPLIQGSLLLVFAASGLLLLGSWREVVARVVRERFVLALLLIAGASALWSELPALTLRRVVAFGGTSLIGVHLAVRYGVPRQLRLLAWVFGIAAVLSLVVIFFLPHYGIMGGRIHPHTWRGIYVHKNTLGRVVATGVIVFMILAGTRHTSLMSRTLFWSGATLSLVLLVFSTSKAALLNTAIVLGVLAALGAWLRVSRLLSAALATLVLLSGILALEITGHWTLPRTVSRSIESFWGVETRRPGRALASGGEQPADNAERARAGDRLTNLVTLTGRVELWTFLRDDVRARPWLGYGYGAFWRSGEDGPSADVLRRVSRWNPPHAHNGFLDLWLNVGLLGLVVFLAGFGAALIAAAGRLVEHRTWLSGWPLIFLVYFALVNLTESSLARHNQILWSLYVATVLSLSVTRLPDHEESPAAERATDRPPPPTAPPPPGSSARSRAHAPEPRAPGVAPRVDHTPRPA